MEINQSEFKHKLLKHLVYALIIGLVLRLLTSYFSYGAMALDDYRHGIWPAFQNWSGTPPNLPAYRSHLIIWLIGFFYSVADFFGVTGPIGQVRIAYMGLGLISLSGVVGTYYHVKNSLNYRYSLIAIYLSAAYFLAPFAGTRAFGECIAIGLIMLGFGMLKAGEKDNRVLYVLISFLAIGFATLFRFQVGLIYVAVGLYFIYRKHWLYVGLGIFTGLFFLSLQVGIDFLSHKEPLETLLAYFKVNQGGAVGYGVSPWYNSWLVGLGFTLFPFSLVFANSFKKLWSKYTIEIVSVGFFLLIHGLIPHKEERFIFPIMLVMTLMLSYLVDENWNKKRVRFFFIPMFLTVNILGLIIATFSNSQGSELGPIEYMESRYDKYVLLSKDSVIEKSRVKDYYLRDQTKLIMFDKRTLLNQENLLSVKEDLAGAKAIAIMTSKTAFREELKVLENQSFLGLNCTEIQSAQSLSDWILFSTNPGKNKKRGPNWFLVCEITQ